jgi:single-stranded-DNA-specific exonuclease
MNKTWLDPQEIPIPENLREVVGGHPLVAETLTRRGISEPDKVRSFLDPDEYMPTQANELPGLNQAADLIEAAIDKQQKILVWGDFDVDGQTATTLLVEALQALGAEVSYYIPIRAIESHGIKTEKLAQLLTPTSPPPSILLTCDTGISEHEAVDYAKSQGLTVIITDHHDLPPALPNADAIVNSKLLPQGHPLSTLPGVGVAYKLVEELYARRRETGDWENISPPEKFLDLVALGIVADIALQIGDARYLLQRGLEVLRRTPRLGLQALFKNAGIVPDQISEEQIGFGIAPRLNALGRLSDANPSVEFFTTHNPSQANILATHLEGLNSKRRLLSDQIYQAAMSQIERQPELLQYAAIVLSHPQWPAGVIGIVASRLVEEFNKPTILLSIPEGQAARGSARSIEGLHITEAIAAQSEMLHGFGGHPMAAGLSLDSERIPDFRHALSRTIRKMMGPEAPEPTLPIDAYIDLDELGLELVDDLGRLAPFGAGNPALILATRDLHLVSQTTIGRDQKHLRLVVADQHGHNQDVIWWRGAGQPMPNGRFDMAYTIQANTFRGQRGLQVIWQDSRQSEATTPEVDRVTQDLEIVDYRSEQHPLALLEQIKTQGNVLIFTEGDAKRRFPSGGRDRNQLAPAEKLVLWSTPSGPDQLSDIMTKVNPSQVYLFAIDPQLDQPDAFLERLAGLVKHTLNARQGRVDLRTLAAAMAHRETTLRAGLSWMEEKGLIGVEWRGESGEALISPGGEPGLALEAMAMILQAMLDETAAYRAYLRSVDSEAIFS